LRPFASATGRRNRNSLREGGGEKGDFIPKCALRGEGKGKRGKISTKRYLMEVKKDRAKKKKIVIPIFNIAFQKKKKGEGLGHGLHKRI